MLRLVAEYGAIFFVRTCIESGLVTEHRSLASRLSLIFFMGIFWRQTCSIDHAHRATDVDHTLSIWTANVDFFYRSEFFSWRCLWFGVSCIFYCIVVLWRFLYVNVRYGCKYFVGTCEWGLSLLIVGSILKLAQNWIGIVRIMRYMYKLLRNYK